MSGFVRQKFLVWRLLDNDERQCGQRLALCGLCTQTDDKTTTTKPRSLALVKANLQQA